MEKQQFLSSVWGVYHSQDFKNDFFGFNEWKIHFGNGKILYGSVKWPWMHLAAWPVVEVMVIAMC